LNDEKLLWTQCSENIRREIRKAQNRFSLNIRNDLSVQEFLDLNEKTFARQGMKLPYSRKFVTRLDTACRERSARKIFIAEDSEGRRHAGVYTVWDENSAYYLMGGSEPTLRNSGAMSFCMWEAIRFSATVTKNLDFEGSMLEPVERFFRAFGAIQTPYFSIEKTPSRLIRLRNSMVNLLR
jgi:lipid II:glycine glycyltransferase (peptidoglycan interpeptide bridge formation enzyme)